MGPKRLYDSSNYQPSQAEPSSHPKRRQTQRLPALQANTATRGIFNKTPPKVSTANIPNEDESAVDDLLPYMQDPTEFSDKLGVAPPAMVFSAHAGKDQAQLPS
jgi:hypothetical protein